MAFCTNCGRQAAPEHQFCISCGTPIRHEQASAPDQSAQITEPTAPSQIDPGPPPVPLVPPPPVPSQPVAAIPVSAPPLAAFPPPAFCQACGKPISGQATFCQQCGAPLHASAPATAQTAPPYAVPQPAFPAPQPPSPAYFPAAPAAAAPHKTRTGLWVAIVSVVLLVLIIAVILNSGPNPEDSFDHARTAYLQHDQVTFDKYVDVNSVLSDWTDQALNVWLKQQNAGAMETAAAQIVAAALKSAYLPQVAQQIDQFVVTGTLPDQASPNDNDQSSAFVANSISGLLRAIASSQLTYEGVDSKTVSGNSAVLNVRIAASFSNSPLIVKVAMQRDGDYWRITAIPDVAGLLSQLNTSTGD
jgi:hypothetical protein